VGAEPEAREHGLLAVGDGHEVYWERSGTPGAKPAVILHGGPGSGCSPGMRRFLDPELYDLVLFDQRGAGRSRPYAGAPLADLSANTTHHLVADIERLREHLGIERWLVAGGSWGTTLALAYAQAHPQRVTEMVLVSVGTTTRREVEWITRDMGRVFPEEWERFRDGVPEAERAGDLAAAYARLLADSDPAVHQRAADDWCAWEDAHIRTHPDEPGNRHFADPANRLCFARLVTHYWSHAAWIEDGALLAGVTALADIPAALIHGRRDVSSPLDVPWALAAAWPGAQLTVVDEGHAGGPEMAAAIGAAAQRFSCSRRRAAGRHR
jgi:proline iminopeptidase